MYFRFHTTVIDVLTDVYIMVRDGDNSNGEVARRTRSMHRVSTACRILREKSILLSVAHDIGPLELYGLLYIGPLMDPHKRCANRNCQKTM